MAELTEQEIYNRLIRFKMSENELDIYGYPYRDLNNPELRMPVRNGLRQTLSEHFADRYECYRCKKIYRVGRDGVPLATEARCTYHPRQTWNKGRYNEYYLCCERSPASVGCASNQYHVQRDNFLLENYRGYVETQAKPERDPDRHGVFALDCEMCYTTYGLELTRITVVNYKYEVVYERLVRPGHPILDINTATSGIELHDLNGVNTTLADVQRDLLAMFSNKTILVGHGLENDMNAVKMFHKYIIDTSELYPHNRGLPFKRSLKYLARDHLHYEIQNGTHDSSEDAIAAFRLVKRRAGIN